ncbi:hypothetical protein [Nocardioides stalactiti]|uniref:hypothetical protein n=1 Tax=Nocardioides stalactiti TaxID=2755356 RepID=UPI001601B9CA|nr:hypothetical protein [Nocardioides stalactiti]
MLKLLVVVLVFAAVTYFVTRALQERDARGSTAARKPLRPKRPSAPPRPVAPDDDEDFLRDLDRKRLNPQDPPDET